jgi:dTDP-4-dehydrorhamnose 3,5-epimerase-like enzyme
MKSTTLQDVQLITIPKIEDPRGNLAVVEKDRIPFAVQRVYYLYEVPKDAYRGGHAHKQQLEFLIAVNGSFDVIVNDGSQKKTFTLDKPDQGLLLPIGIWRELEGFTKGSVCLVLSSGIYEEDDYIRSYDDFLSSKGLQ